jgi:uncharacterized protein YehS (DUF1456 family)
MDNNDILARLRYALNIKDTDMVEIFKLGGVEVTKEEVRKMLLKSKDRHQNEAGSLDDIEENSDFLVCNNVMTESFLNGFIIFKRGEQESRPEQTSVKGSENINNVMLKKVKIALSLTSEDMIDILNEAGVSITKGELSAVLRKEGHRNYKECGDRYARNFLKGLALKYRR